MEQVFSGIYRAQLTLPKTSLRSLNSYVIEDGDGFAIVDTGFNLDQTYEELVSQLAENGFRLEDITKIVITHFHGDHIGLTQRLRRFCSQPPMLHEAEIALVKLAASGLEKRFGPIAEYMRLNGMPKELVEKVLRQHPAVRTRSIDLNPNPWTPLRDGDLIQIGGFEFRAVWTPGHSPGHVCLYEPKKRILIAGDHILPKITPNITRLAEDDDPLTKYLQSLKKVEALDVDLVLPAHRWIYRDHRERIRQLRQHHRRRLSEVIEILSRKKEATAFEIASEMTWDVDYPSWEAFPAFQKHFAHGEALAHLKPLEDRGLVRKKLRGDVVYYEMVNPVFPEDLEPLLT